LVKVDALVQGLLMAVMPDAILPCLSVGIINGSKRIVYLSTFDSHIRKPQSGTPAEFDA
jgi:hypothetical protein